MNLHLTLSEEINCLIRKKADTCNCTPCICSDDVKEKYFKEIKSALEKYNHEYLATSLINKHKFNNNGYQSTSTL
jgi:hypothetical protein